LRGSENFLAAQMTQTSCNNPAWQDGAYRFSDSNPVPLLLKICSKGETPMARFDSGYLPHENPCAQCGKPIAAPDWTENGPRRISYLWHCRACDYRFEAVAYYDASHPGREALAA
jgi:hypothetical protein